MVDLDGAVISSDKFKRIAEREGYVEEFEYPIYMESLGDGLVVKFTDLRAGEVVAGETHFISLGYKCDNFVPHNNNTHWKEYQPHESLKIQYAEDAKTMEEPWLLWEFNFHKDSWHSVGEEAPFWEPDVRYRRKEVKPKTYDGYTLDQLNQAKAEGVLFEFWDDGSRVVSIELLESVVATNIHPFNSTNNCWKHCRIHRSQPQFVIDGKKPDWLDDDTVVVVTYENGGSRYRRVRLIKWADVTRFQVVEL